MSIDQRVSGETQRPLWSVMIPAYNCSTYLGRTLESVLSQAPDPSRMQVEVVDDASAEDIQALVAAIGGSRVSYYRQPRNVGHVRNFNECIRRARGSLIHILHGDDYVLPGFYDEMAEPFLSSSPPGLAYCRHAFVNGDDQQRALSPLERETPGLLAEAWREFAIELRVQCSSVVVRREVYEQIGGFHEAFLYCGEDWDMWVRVACRFPVWFEPRVLAAYREHGGSLYKRSALTAQNTYECLRAVEHFSRFLPASRRRIRREARRTCARWALSDADLLLAAGRTDGARAQLWAALHCGLTPAILRRLLSIWRRMRRQVGVERRD